MDEIDDLARYRDRKRRELEDILFQEEPRDKVFDRIKELCLQQVQLDKGMPMLQTLDPELEKLMKGGDTNGTQGQG